MSDLKLSIPHNLPAEEALNRIKDLLGNLKKDHKDLVDNAEESWEGNTGQFSFSAKGFDLSGTINVSPSGVDIDAKLPFALSFFKGKISQVITDKAKELLS
ncbi:MAG: hypothetical protein E6Q24_08385 [Chitinophagaceae bacterium]|jgi:hypothetical protein|nr:polyhydroxyalkanoic acid system family protein [Sphingobacteriales bacterium]OJV99996.1 MAG: hypothetical protein BGO52_02690 [Sphingobacteriales bacterium 44-61]TXJ27464.1 MAG: hypothetical protein E6Q24_08385 [Chitinophagaceae bacterium]